MILLFPGAPNTAIGHVGEAAWLLHFGLFRTPSRPSNNVAGARVPYALDNGCFGTFDEQAWRAMLFAYQSVPGCLFSVVPDVVCDAKATQALFEQWSGLVMLSGYPIAYVAQNGAENINLPWNSFDALFIGGDTRWKLGPEAAQLAADAKRRGKWLHMGRVNSERRIRYAQAIGCDSIDGTGYVIEPRKVIKALQVIKHNTQQKLFAF